MNGYTYGQAEPVETCPYCGYDQCHADFLDIGVGYQQCAPFGCDRCHAVEVGPYDRDVDLSDEEKRTGWYAPDPVQ